MEKEQLDAFMMEWIRVHGAGVWPGAMLLRHGPEDYVGATLAVRGTLYFKGSHAPEVREAICQCFDAYEVIAKQHLTWLWRAEPPEGPDKFTYKKAKPMRQMMKRMDEDDCVGFAYIGGEKAHEASPWLFYVYGHRAWQAKMGTWGLDSLEFSLPRQYVEANPVVFQELFVTFARLLKAEHGHGGFAINLSVVRGEDSQQIEGLMVSKMNGLDAGTGASVAGKYKQGINDHIKTIGWLTAINHQMLDRVGEVFAINSELPMDWFAQYDYGHGIVVQAGPQPEIASVELDPKPAIYVLPNRVFKCIRMPEIGILHYGFDAGDLRLHERESKQWLQRFDIPEEEVLSYKAKLLKEPKLTQASTLPDRL